MRLLIIAPAFAPYSSVGTARISSLVKYLVSKNHDITVLCNDPVCWPQNMMTRLVPAGIRLVKIKASPIEKEGYPLYESVADDLLHKNSYDLILCTVGPWHCFYFITKLSKAYDIPYVIDKRDTWIFDSHFFPSPLRYIKRVVFDYFLYWKIEKRVMNNAIAIVEVTEACRKKTEKRFPNAKGVFYTIRNGFDSLEALDSMNSILFSVPTFVITGKTYSTTLLKRLLLCFKHLNSNGIYCRLIHVGEKEKLFSLFCEKFQISESIAYECGFLSYNETMKIIDGALCTIVIINRDKYGLGTKVYDYIKLNKPIIAYSNSNKLYLPQFVSQFPNGFACSKRIELEEIIKTVIEQNIHELGCNDIEIYSRDSSNIRYEKFLCSLLSKEIN